jgi:hypothetical protein
MSIRIMTRAWDVSVGMADKLVLLALADIADDDGRCFPSLAHIGRKCGMHRATVLRAIATLETEGHLSRDSRTGRSSIYTVHPLQKATGTSSTELPVAQSNQSLSATPPVAQRDPTRRTARRDPSLSATHIRQLPVNYPSRDTQEAREAPRGTSDETDYSEWLATIALYPPNAARQDLIGAERASCRLVADGLATWSELREGVSRYAALCRATNRLVMNPVKFFTDPDRPWAQPWPLPPSKAEAKRDANIDESLKWLEKTDAAA